jgi:protocatechuate 3,4-dioxygenase beta subunit
MLWGDLSSPFLICPSRPGNVTAEVGIQYLYGNATLEVKVLAPDDTPLQNLEVDLWTADAPPGSPNVGIKCTDKDGIATFKIPPGNYKIGFNANNFPENLIYPEQVEVEVTEKEAAQKIIKLQPK